MGQNSQILRRPQDDKKVGGCHPMFADPFFRRQNSQILRRPQDDNDGGKEASE